MENTEEAVVHDNGSVTIIYYFGKKLLIPAYIMETLYEDAVYEENTRDGKIR